MRNLGGVLFAVSIVLCADAEAQAVEIGERTNHYVVRGATARDLGAQMAMLGPVSQSGRRSWAFTDWEVRTTYVLVPTDGGCEVSDSRAHVELTTTLPDWPGNGGASWRLRARWKEMLVHLVRHENTHRTHALLAGERAAAGLHTLARQDTCNEAERQARRVLREAVQASRRLSLEFDRATDYGASEGVSLEEGRDAATRVGNRLMDR